MNRTQQKILLEISLNEDHVTITNFLNKISIREKIPLSTLRWNTDILRKLGLIICGNSEEKGISVALTKGGELISKILGGEEK